MNLLRPQVTDPQGNLQYIPFPTCAETKAPLALRYLHSAPLNCTITLTDPLFHLLEFYVHNDAPLTCRVPAQRTLTAAADIQAMAGLAAGSRSGDATSLGHDAEGYVPLVVALSGALQRSHLHVANWLNLVVHVGDDAKTQVQARKSKRARR
jgi:hypothetical protein